MRVPIGVLLAFPVLLFLGLMSLRTARRLLVRIKDSSDNLFSGKLQETRRILGLGAGQPGQALAKSLDTEAQLQMIGFLDDDPRMSDKVIQGVRVLGPIKNLPEIYAESDPDEVVLAIPSLKKKRGRNTVYSKIFEVTNSNFDETSLREGLGTLEQAALRNDVPAIFRALGGLDIDYSPPPDSQWVT